MSLRFPEQCEYPDGASNHAVKTGGLFFNDVHHVALVVKKRRDLNPRGVLKEIPGRSVYCEIETEIENLPFLDKEAAVEGVKCTRVCDKCQMEVSFHAWKPSELNYEE